MLELLPIATIVKSISKGWKDLDYGEILEFPSEGLYHIFVDYTYASDSFCIQFYNEDTDQWENAFCRGIGRLFIALPRESYRYYRIYANSPCSLYFNKVDLSELIIGGRRIKIEKVVESRSPTNYLVPKGSHIVLKDVLKEGGFYFFMLFKGAPYIAYLLSGGGYSTIEGISGKPLLLPLSDADFSRKTESGEEYLCIYNSSTEEATIGIITRIRFV